MRSRVNEILVDMIKKRHNSTLTTWGGIPAFHVELDDATTLDFFIEGETVNVWCTEEKNYIRTILRLHDFNEKSGVDEFSFNLNHYELYGCIDKRKAFTDEEMIIYFQICERQKQIVSQENLNFFFLEFCRYLTKVALYGIESILKKEDLGISLRDFGYVYYE